MNLLAIDPGNTHSAYVVYDGAKPIQFGKVDNEWLLDRMRTKHFDASHMAVEMIASYGMSVGREVFETCVVIGQLLEAWSRPHTLVFRREVKLHLCGSPRAKDSNIRTALIDRYGGKEKAIGRKATPGVLFGISADCWSALAIAVTFSETHPSERAA